MPLPSFLHDFIDKYIDSLKPELVPKYERGIEIFQSSTLDKLEDKLLVKLGLKENNTPDEGSRGILDDALGFFQDIPSKLNPMEKVREVIPKIKENVAVALEEKHRGLADKFGDMTTAELKEYLGTNVSARDIGSSAIDDVKDALSSLNIFGKKEDSSDRSASKNDEGGVFKMFSKKVREGVEEIKQKYQAKMHEALTKIEGELWEALPDQIQSPLETIFGGNPFEKDQGNERGLLSAPFEKMQQRMTKSLRDLVHEGHVELEDYCVRESKETIKGKISKYINVEE